MKSLSINKGEIITDKKIVVSIEPTVETEEKQVQIKKQFYQILSSNDKINELYEIILQYITRKNLKLILSHMIEYYYRYVHINCRSFIPKLAKAYRDIEKRINGRKIKIEEDKYIISRIHELGCLLYYAKKDPITTLTQLYRRDVSKIYLSGNITEHFTKSLNILINNPKDPEYEHHFKIVYILIQKIPDIMQYNILDRIKQKSETIYKLSKIHFDLPEQLHMKLSKMYMNFVHLLILQLIYYTSIGKLPESVNHMHPHIIAQLLLH
jgi:hypothetical protein